MILRTKPNSNQQLTAKTFLLYHYLGFELETKPFMAEFEILQGNNIFNEIFIVNQLVSMN